MILRRGIPLVVSLDSGKVEAMQKIIENELQSEAAGGGMEAVEELNSAFLAWTEMQYNTRIRSSTGQAPVIVSNSHARAALGPGAQSHQGTASRPV